MSHVRVPIGLYYIYADPQDGTGHLFVEQGLAFEAHIRRELEQRLPTCHHFLDIGANVGFHTISAKSINPTLQVTAIETNPASVDLLVRAAAENNLTNLTIISTALAEGSGFIQTDRRYSNAVCAPLGTWPAEAPGATYAPCTPLDLYHLPNVDLVKMDVDGYEWRVLQGATRLIAQRPVWLFEYHLGVIARGGIEGPELLHFFKELGYSLTLLDFVNDARVPVSDVAQAHTYVGRLPEQCVDVLATPCEKP
jgi:FkbM family methyltransferase